jgi:hypothetical protein
MSRQARAEISKLEVRCSLTTMGNHTKPVMIYLGTWTEAALQALCCLSQSWTRLRLRAGSSSPATCRWGIGRQQLNRLHHLYRDIMPMIKIAVNWKKLHWISETIVGLYLWMMVGWGSTRKLEVRPVCITLPSAQVTSSLSHPDRTRAYQSPPLGRILWYLHGESGGKGQEINRKNRACHKHIDETRHIDQTNYSIMNYFSLEFRTFGNISNMYRSKHMISYIVH